MLWTAVSAPSTVSVSAAMPFLRPLAKLSVRFRPGAGDAPRRGRRFAPTRSRSVGAVLDHVALGQVAAPGHGTPLAQAQIDAQSHLGRAELVARRLAVERRRGALPARPLASRKTLSLVLVSPSMLTRLKLSRTASRRQLRSMSGSTAA